MATGFKMKKFTLLHGASTDSSNSFILYSTRSNGTHYFIGSATVDRIKNNLFEISKFNTRNGYKKAFLKALFQFFYRINSYLSSSVPIAAKSAFKDDFHSLFINKDVSKIKTPFDRSLSVKHECLEYGYKPKMINMNLTFSTDKRKVSSRMQDWSYFSNLFPADAATIDALEPISL